MARNLNEQLHQARTRLQNGDLDGAAQIIAGVMQRAPANPDANYMLGVLHMMRGDASTAIKHLELALRADAGNGALLDHAGLAYLMVGRFQDAERVLRKAAAIPSAPPVVSMRLGMALLHQEKFNESIQHLKSASLRAPGEPEYLLNLGQALHRSGNTAGAREAFHSVLKILPANADATFNIGALFLDDKAYDDAKLWFERALLTDPRHVESLVNLGVVLEHQQQLDAALQCYRSALDIQPRQATASNNLGHVLLLLGRASEAREQYLAALHLFPDSALLREGAAAACMALGRYGEAVPHLRHAIQGAPDNPQSIAALARALLETGQLDEAEILARKIWRADDADSCSLLAQILLMGGKGEESVSILEAGFAQTGAPGLLGMLTFQYRQHCDWEKWRSAWEKLEPQLHTSTELGSPFWLLCQPSTAEDQLLYTQAWAAQRFKGIALLPPQPARASRTRVRVGYLSSDFRDHAAAYLIADVLDQHDRDKFEVFAYSHGPDDGSAMRRRLSLACEHFIDIAWEPDDAAAERIRGDALDILVDLKGYTVGDRLTIMARRPCTTQITWVGYPGTTGASFIDYLIADPHIVLDGQEHMCSEHVLRMPHCYQPNDRKRRIAEPRSRVEYGLPESGFVFCCFNQTFKIGPEVFEVWLRLLQRVSGSVLWVVDDHRIAKENLRKTAQVHGVDPQRLVFAPRLPYAEHLARYRVADLALDTFPYTSHTTLSDTLWCGCPLIGLEGNTFASRVSGSLLRAANMPDLITASLSDYERLATNLAGDHGALHIIRERIAQARDRAPLFDSYQFTRDLEKLYLSLINK